MISLYPPYISLQYKWVLAAILLFLSVLTLTACNNTEAQRAATMQQNRSDGYIKIAENNINLRTVRMSDGKVDIPFSFYNAGDEAVVLIEGTTSCMCTEAVVKSMNSIVSPRIRMSGHGPTARIAQILEPGEQAQLIATFDPNAHGPSGTGPIMREVFLTTNSTETPNVSFRFNGNVVP